MKITHNDTEVKIHTRLPALPLRNLVIFPHTVYPLLIGRQFTINALQEAMLLDKQVFLCSQRSPEQEKPGVDDLHNVGVVARVLQVMKLPNGALKALVESMTRARVVKFNKTESFFSVKIAPLDKPEENTKELEALSRSVIDGFSEYVRLNSRIPDESLVSISRIDDHSRLADTVASQLLVKQEIKQRLLECVSIGERFKEMAKLMASEIEILKLERKIDTSVSESITQGQRERYLQQQLKAIREELGHEEAGAGVEDLIDKLQSLEASEEVKLRADEEIQRLSRMHPYSAEAAVARGYLEWIFALPWSTTTRDRTDFDEVQKLLDDDHYGLEKPKRRILEHLAVLRLSKKVRGPILCLVGPPGVGKTSLGKSIAHALERKFVRGSLGGVSDEAEIRGHRRTYIGSLPGRIIQGMKKAGANNPVFLLDEIDKIRSDFRGDPSSALLEALDPEQNSTFSDNYLELDFDLSHTLFITTANSTSGIPHALLDRLEVIHLPGYTEHEKVKIANTFLLPKLIEEMGLSDFAIEISDKTLLTLIRRYTHEAGVRELGRKLNALLRDVATRIARMKRAPRKRVFAFTERDLKKILGVERHTGMDIKTKPTLGYAVGLAWTRLGGETLAVEASVMPGGGKLTLTGKLGEVMKESATAALSYIRAHAADFGVETNFLKKNDIHIHVPEGAVPKDGPSAGTSIAVAMLSALTGAPTRELVAMTGEITLSGDILRIGGLNEKLLAAKRAGIVTVILPASNRPDLAEIKPEVTEGLSLNFVQTIDQVFKLAFSAPIKRKQKKTPAASSRLSPLRVSR